MSNVFVCRRGGNGASRTFKPRGDSKDYRREWAVRSASLVKGNGAWKRGPCEACKHRLGKEDDKHKFNYNSSTGGFCCLRCGFKGRLTEKELDSLGFAVEGVNAEPPKVVIPKPEGFTPLYEEPGWSAPQFALAHAYLERRGVSPEMMLEAGIGACTTGRYRGRVVVPIRSRLDPENWQGFSARAFYTGTNIPYLYPEGMDREHLLYNEDALYEETDEPAIIVEGVFDAIYCWPNGVAVLGTPSESQIQKLSQANRPLAVVLDGDAWEQGWSLAARLRFEGCTAGSVHLPPKLDPDEVPLLELLTMARDCVYAPL
jgi:hypothetical protein